ncbi:MAG: TIGR03862 family flavoprotein [Pseudomonadales bacterium]
MTRYREAAARLAPALDACRPEQLRAWSHALGVETFVGSSGRVFPTMMKGSPLLRSWLRALADAGVTLHTRHQFTGWSADGALCFSTPEGTVEKRPDATLMALGGGSWPRLGSDGAWVPVLQAAGIATAPLAASNCGIEISWPPEFSARHAGTPLRSMQLTCGKHSARGDAMITTYGLEGSPVYTLGAEIRAALGRGHPAVLHLDLAPAWTLAALAARLARPRGTASFTNHLRKTTRLPAEKLALLRTALTPEAQRSENHIAFLIKQLPLETQAMRPITEAISSAGGVLFNELDENYMARRQPGLFLAGEMLDWDAPTGGYLLTACFATGRAAARGALGWLGVSLPSVRTAAPPPARPL